MFKALGFHTISKVFVVLAGYILHFCLGHILTRQEYGVVGTVIAFCNFYYMFLTNGVRQGISKMLSTELYDSRTVIRKGMTLQCILSFILAGVNFLLAPVFAEAFGDASFEQYIKMISVLIPLTAIYFAFTGGLNGSKLFLAEAVVISVYPLLRLLSVPLSFVYPENKVIMVIVGFSLASLLSAVLAASLLFTSKKIRQAGAGKEQVTNKQIIRISADFIIFFAAITLVLNMDTFFLQYVCKDTGKTGFYTGVHTFSLVPYYLISAFYLVILPYVSENYVKGNMEKIKGIVAKNFNIIFTVVLPITALISVTAPDLLANFYNKEYHVAGNALTILSIGTFLLSSFAVFNVVLSGINCKLFSAVISAVMVVMDVVLLMVLIPHGGIVGAATATTISALTGCVVAVIYLIKKIGNPFDLKTMSKSLLLTLVFVVLAKVLFEVIAIDSLVKLIVAYAVLGTAYIACMLIFKVVNIKELIKKEK